MITPADLSAVDLDQVQILDSNGYRIVLRSRSTGHCWCLLEQAASGRRSFQVLHRHRDSCPYHIQTYRPSIEACCVYIVQHDAFHLEREAAKQKRRRQAIERRKAAREMEAGRAGREAL